MIPPFIDVNNPDELPQYIMSSVVNRDANILSQLCLNQNVISLVPSLADEQGTSILSLAGMISLDMNPPPGKKAQPQDIQWIVSTRCYEVVRILLKSGAHVNDANAYGWSPLMVACNQGDIKLVKLLIQKGGDVNAVSTYGLTPLLCAIRSYAHGGAPIGKDLGLISLLVETAGANVNQGGGLLGITPVMLAAHLGIVEVTQYLVKNGAECNAQSKLNGWTPLMYAANKLDSLKEKPQTSLRVNMMSGTSPFSFKGIDVPLGKGEDIIRILCEKGADHEIRNRSGETAIFIADKRGKDLLSIVKRINQNNENGSSVRRTSLVGSQHTPNSHPRAMSEESHPVSDMEGLSISRSKTANWFSRLRSTSQGAKTLGAPTISTEEQKQSMTRSFTMKVSRWDTLNDDVLSLDPFNSPDSAGSSAGVSPAMPRRPQGLSSSPKRD